MRILAIASILVLLPVSPAAASRALTFQACADVPEADCASLTVPVDRARPDGPQVSLAVARRKATDPARRIGVLLVNPGGPGGSAAQYAKDAPKTFSPEVLARFDVVGYDPRGVGDSQPIYCDTSAVGVPYPSGRPDTPERFAQQVEYNRRLNDDCRTRTGPVFDRVDAQSAAQDMDDLRKALGEQKVSYYGQSYGTLYGQKYAERYGKHVRAMVIDSVMDASQPLADLLETGARAGEGIFTEFVRWCGVTPSCALHGEDIPSLYADLRARAARGDLHTPGLPDVPLTVAELANRTVRFGYSADFTRMGEYLLSLTTQPEAGFSAAVATRRPQAVLCQDVTGHPRSAADVTAMDARVRAAAPNVQASPIWDLALVRCIGWQGPELNPALPWRPETAPRVLVLNSVHDPATGYENAVSVHRQAQGKAVLVTDRKSVV